MQQRNCGKVFARRKAYKRQLKRTIKQTVLQFVVTTLINIDTHVGQTLMQPLQNCRQPRTTNTVDDTNPHKAVHITFDTLKF